MLLTVFDENIASNIILIVKINQVFILEIFVELAQSFQKS